MCDEKNYESLSVVRPHRSPRKCVTKIKTKPFQFQPNSLNTRISRFVSNKSVTKATIVRVLVDLCHICTSKCDMILGVRVAPNRFLLDVNQRKKLETSGHTQGKGAAVSLLGVMMSRWLPSQQPTLLRQSPGGGSKILRCPENGIAHTAFSLSIRYVWSARRTDCPFIETEAL